LILDSVSICFVVTISISIVVKAFMLSVFEEPLVFFHLLSFWTSCITFVYSVSVSWKLQS